MVMIKSHVFPTLKHHCLFVTLGQSGKKSLVEILEVL